MADTVFRVQVGAQIQTSTTTLRSDIQNILNDIGKRNPPKVTVGLAKTATKTKLTTDLNDLLTKQNIGITLGLKGGGSLRGSSGAKITKELIDITSQLSQNQAAKITLHLNASASQKALLSELKKLDLGVNITPRQQQKQSSQPTTAKYGPAMPASSYTPTASDYAQVGEAAKNVAFKIQTAADASSLLRQNLQQAAQEPVPDYSKFQGQVGDVVDNLGQMWNGQHKQALVEENKLLSQAAVLQKQIYDLQRQQTTATEGTATYDQLQKQIEQKQAEYARLQSAYLQSSSAQSRGATAESFSAEVQAVNKVTQALEKYSIAKAKAETSFAKKTGKQDEKALDQARDLSANVDKLKASLNQAVPASAQYAQELDRLEDTYYAGAIDLDQYKKALGQWETAAEKAGAKAESAGQKFSRMLGEKIGYGAIALVLAKVRQALGQIYTNVVNIDAAMTELKKVTDETDAAYEKFLSQSGAKARELGSTMTDVVNATAGFARLGYSLADSAELAQTAIVYNNVGDGIESVDDATESVISTMQAFNITAQDSMSIADKFNQIGRQNCPAA